MTAALITLVCLSIDIPPPTLSAMVMNCKQSSESAHSQCSKATNAIGGNVALDVALGL